MRGYDKLPLPVPRLGLGAGGTSPEIPDGALWRGKNVVPRFGELHLRPGLEKVTTTGPGARISGGAFFKTVSGSSRVVAATNAGWWKMGATSWTDITGAALTGTTDDP